MCIKKLQLNLYSQKLQKGTFWRNPFNFLNGCIDVVISTWPTQSYSVTWPPEPEQNVQHSVLMCFNNISFSNGQLGLASLPFR